MQFEAFGLQAPGAIKAKGRRISKLSLAETNSMCSSSARMDAATAPSAGMKIWTEIQSPARRAAQRQVKSAVNRGFNAPGGHLFTGIGTSF